LCPTEPHEVLFTQADLKRISSHRTNEIGDRLYLLQAASAHEHDPTGSSPPTDRQQAGGTLVYDLPVLDAPSRAFDIWSVDLHRARVEGLYKGARLAMGPVVENTAPIEPQRRVTDLKTRCKAVAWLKVFWLILTGQWRFPE